MAQAKALLKLVETRELADKYAEEKGTEAQADKAAADSLSESAKELMLVAAKLYERAERKKKEAAKANKLANKYAAEEKGTEAQADKAAKAKKLANKYAAEEKGTEAQADKAAADSLSERAKELMLVAAKLYERAERKKKEAAKAKKLANKYADKYAADAKKMEAAPKNK